MRQVEFWRWRYVDSEDGTTKSTVYRMNREEAQKRFPGAVAVPGSLEMRSVPDDSSEWNTAGAPRRE